jgi:hypothetical protein
MLFDESAFTTSAGLAVGSMAAIETWPTDDLDIVHAKEEALHIIHETHLGRWRRLADLWVSAYFGNDMSAAEYADLARRVQGRPGATMSDEQAARYLTHPAVVDNDSFHWELEFPEVFFDRHGRPKGDAAGFDAVIGNPPYANAWAMTSLDNETRQAIELLSPNPHLLSGHWDLYAAFIAQSLKLARLSATHAFIVPDALTREKYAGFLREHLLTQKTIVSIMHFEGVNVFDEVSRHCIIYSLKNQPPPRNSVTRVHTPLTGGNAVEEHGVIAQSDWLKLKDYQIRLRLADEQVKSIIDKFTSSDFIQIGQFCYVMVGATTHSKEEGTFTKSDIIAHLPKGNAKRFFDGKNLSRYQIQWDGRYIDYRPSEMYGPRVPALFESPKVLVRDVTGANEQLIVSYDDAGLYCDHLVTCVTYYENVENTGVQTSFEDYPRIQSPYPSLLYVTAILASKLMTWYFREVFATGTLQGSYSHTYPQQVRAFPIPRASSSPNDREEHEFLKGVPGLLEQNQAQQVLIQVDAFLVDDDSYSVHDLLAYLAKQMIALHQEKQTLTADFWTDLEGAAEPAAFRKLRDRGKQEAGLWAEAALRPFVRESSKRARTLDESLAWDEAAFKAFVRALAGPVDNLSGLLKVCGRYAPRYREATTRIERTDWLIDQIVYKLYGLTEEEIAIVEGRGV